MKDLLRAELRTATPYRAADVGSVLNLRDNTSLWGPPPCALDAVCGLEGRTLANYPATSLLSLHRALAGYVGAAADRIVTGCGSDNLIDVAMRAFVDPGGTVAFTVPTFSVVPTLVAINGLRSHAVPLTSDFDVDVDRLLAPRPALVYLCSPNNPAGPNLPVDTIERVLRGAPGVVVLDEAYAEFTSAPGPRLAREHPRLIVVRTLSKAFGLAGLRIGYSVVHASLGPALETLRGPYTVNVAAEAAACAALREGVSWIRACADAAVQSRDRLRERLVALGFAPLPSDANFLCVPCRDAGGVAARILERGVAVRTVRDLPPITAALARSGGDALRITVGPWPAMEQVLAALEPEVRSCA